MHADARLRRTVVAGSLASGLVVACAAGVWMASPAVTVVTAGLAAALVARAVWQAIGHARLAAVLRRDSEPDDAWGVAVRWRSLTARAAVAGVRRPEIFCDPQLPTELGPAELRAVVLHERHHQLQRDPLRLLALSSVEPVVGVLPAGRRWLAHQRGRLEVAADRYAIDRGVHPSEIAGAMLKMAGGPPVAAPAAGFVSATDVRLAALLGEPLATTATGRPSRWLAIALGVTAATCGAAVLHHHVTAIGGGIGCLFAGC